MLAKYALTESMNPKMFLKILLAASLTLPALAELSGADAFAQSTLGVLRGVTRDPGGFVCLPRAQVTLHSLDDGSERAVPSGADGAFVVANLKPGRYQIMAQKQGFADSSVAIVELADGQSIDVDVPLGQSESASPALQKPSQYGFFHRWFKAYADDWKGTTSG